MKPIISIITPFYNAEEYIEETAKSLLSQTFTNFEWIIVDDGSKKQAKERLKEIEKKDSRIKVLTTDAGSNERTCKGKRFWDKKCKSKF